MMLIISQKPSHVRDHTIQLRPSCA
jgi:hypothetical protein